MSTHAGPGPRNPYYNLPLTNPQCMNDSCLAFQAAHNLSQKLVSYTRQFEYGHWVAWYYAMIIFGFALWHVWQMYSSRRQQALVVKRREGTTTASSSSSSSSVLRSLKIKVAASTRYFSYRRPAGRIFDILGLPSAGTLFFLLLSMLFVLILTFSIRPYYRQHRGFGSPPLGVRTGLMAAACIPLLVALSGKASFLTLLTGVGHERLNVYHRWAGWACLALSVAHTIPFLVAPLKDGGPRALRKQFYKKGSFEYTGTPPLAILFGIVIFSLPFVRNRFFESFYVLHIALYITFLGLCFWHFGKEGDSWTYLWATLATYLASTLGRILWFNRTWNIRNGQWIGGGAPVVSMEELPGGMTKVDVEVPAGLRWRPGQHFFVRLPGIDPLGNHPFTIASADRYVDRDFGKAQNEIELEPRVASFFIRTHTGFTKKISDLLSKNPAPKPAASSAWLEGPYGGFPYNIDALCDQIILIAGGGGFTATLPWLEHLTNRWAAGAAIRTKKIVFVWIIRRTEHLSWAAESLNRVDHLLASFVQKDPKSEAASLSIERHLFVTNEVLNQDSNKQKSTLLAPGEKDVEKAVKTAASSAAPAQLDYITTRPKMKELIPQILGSNPQARTTIILGCGPESLRTDLSNASADAQIRILKDSRGSEATETIALHTETFDW